MKYETFALFKAIRMRTDHVHNNIVMSTLENLK